MQCFKVVIGNPLTHMNWNSSCFCPSLVHSVPFCRMNKCVEAKRFRKTFLKAHYFMHYSPRRDCSPQLSMYLLQPECKL